MAGCLDRNLVRTKEASGPLPVVSGEQLDAAADADSDHRERSQRRQPKGAQSDDAGVSDGCWLLLGVDAERHRLQDSVYGRRAQLLAEGAKEAVQYRERPKGKRAEQSRAKRSSR